MANKILVIVLKKEKEGDEQRFSESLFLPDF